VYKVDGSGNVDVLQALAINITDNRPDKALKSFFIAADRI
jgi:hypothetical protein